MSFRSLCVILTFLLSVSGGSARATSSVLDWAYRCGEEDTVVYMAVRTTSFPLLELDLDTSSLILTPTGGSTQSISLEAAAGFRTALLRVSEFNAIFAVGDVVRAGLESNDGLISRWVEITLPALTNGEYSFSASGSRLTSVRSWVATIDCGDDTGDDDTPPVLDCDVATTELWPPNHKLVNVGLTLFELSDDQDPSPTTEIYVYSNEDSSAAKGNGGGKNSGEDAQDVGFDTLTLRAERSGNGYGRVYLIVVVASDASGNRSTACHTVTVPKSQSSKHRQAVNDAADLAKMFCDDEEALADMGFALVGTSVEL